MIDFEFTFLLENNLDNLFVICHCLSFMFGQNACDYCTNISCKNILYISIVIYIYINVPLEMVTK